jgi:C4-dicarboxylate-specific signal transduction histidine kinase
LKAGLHTIKGMGRKEEGARQLLHLNDVIAEVLRLMRSDALAHDCTVLTELQPALPKVEANLVQLQEVPRSRNSTRYQHSQQLDFVNANNR